MPHPQVQLGAHNEQVELAVAGLVRIHIKAIHEDELPMSSAASPGYLHYQRYLLAQLAIT
jgi:hypothetical protein